MDREHTTESRELLSSFVNSTYFDIVATPVVDGGDRAADGPRRGAGRARHPRGHDAATCASGRTATVQIIINGDNANTATTVFGYAQAIVQGVSAELQLQLAGGPGAAAAHLGRSRASGTTPSCRARCSSCPASSRFIVMISCVVSTSLSIVREKERGTWEQVRMAPISHAVLHHRQDDPVLLHLAGVGVPDHRGGDAALRPARARILAAAALRAVSLFVVGALGTGLLVSTLVDSQALAFLIGLLISLLPTFILSGFIFPIASMPAPIQVITYIVPARYFLVDPPRHRPEGRRLRRRWRRSSWRSALYAFVVLALASVRLAKERG